MVGDNILRKAIVPEDLLEKFLSYLESGRETRERDKTAGFGEYFHNNINSGETIRQGKISNKMYRQM